MKQLTSLLCAILLLVSLAAKAQEAKKRNSGIDLPDIPGYMTLKGDFHMHTVFSDGHVWPSFRVREAQQDGLDVISITEHIDYEGFPEQLKYDREAAFRIAEERAEKNGLLVIRGVEISPRVPPYHNNAIFLKDVDALPYDYMKDTHQTFVMKDQISRNELMTPFLEVEKQGGFVFYNHPGYKWWDQKSKVFTDIHQELLDKGILGGVEVVNSGRYNVIAHRMAEKYGLTMFGNSDAHYELEGSFKTHRPMTLIFATEKTEAAIEEAIRDKRTLVYSGNYLVGRQREAEAFFKASLEVEAEKIENKKAPQLRLSLTNNSDIGYQLKCSSEYIIENLPLGRLLLEPHQTVSLLLHPVWEYPEQLSLQMEVENMLVSPEEALKTEILVQL